MAHPRPVWPSPLVCKSFPRLHSPTIRSHLERNVEIGCGRLQSQNILCFPCPHRHGHASNVIDIITFDMDLAIDQAVEMSIHSGQPQLDFTELRATNCFSFSYTISNQPSEIKSRLIATASLNTHFPPQSAAAQIAAVPSSIIRPLAFQVRRRLQFNVVCSARLCRPEKFAARLGSAHVLPAS